jgi:uncharacterized protein YciI
MYLVILDYEVPLEEIDAALPAHRAWLDEGYDAGLFLASGPREPRTGGVILARGERAVIEAALARDPFVLRRLARHELVEFRPSRFGGPLDTDAIAEALA